MALWIGFAGIFIPDNGGFALVGDADGGDISGGESGFLQRLFAGGERGAPDFFRVMFDPAGLREKLLEFLLGGGNYLELVVKNNSPAGGGSLIDCQDMRAMADLLN